MTDKEYSEAEGIRRSDLWKISESPEKFKYLMEHPEEPTPALIFGQAFHKLALEPETFEEEFAVMPNVDRRTTVGKAEYAEILETAEGKTVISADDYEICKAMCEALYRAPYAKRLLSGEREKAFFWDDDLTGERCKCKTDSISDLKDKVIVTDLKSANEADTESFMRAAVKYGYDFQSAMYSEGVKANTGKEVIFVFIVVEKTAPYAVNILQADELFLKRGYDVFRELIGIYHECKQSGEWYGYLGKYNTINNLGLPAWLAKEIE